MAQIVETVDTPDGDRLHGVILTDNELQVIYCLIENSVSTTNTKFVPGFYNALAREFNYKPSKFKLSSKMSGPINYEIDDRPE